MSRSDPRTLFLNKGAQATVRVGLFDEADNPEDLSGVTAASVILSNSPDRSVSGEIIATVSATIDGGELVFLAPSMPLVGRAWGFVVLTVNNSPGPGTHTEVAFEPFPVEVRP